MITDFHSHILPGIDDGSASVKESLELLQMESEQGIETVVATPHFYARHDNPEHFLKKRDQAVRRLREAMSPDAELPEILLGAEVYYFPGISESEVVPMLTIASKKYILIEMPQAPWTDRMYKEIEAIYTKCGITPIIAHVDRYISPFRTHGIPERLDKLPVLVQANANFFLNTSTRKMAMRMLREDRIQLLGSDCHNMKTRRPNLGPAAYLIGQQLGLEQLKKIKYYGQDVLR